MKQVYATRRGRGDFRARGRGAGGRVRDDPPASMRASSRSRPRGSSAWRRSPASTARRATSHLQDPAPGRAGGQRRGRPGLALRPHRAAGAGRRRVQRALPERRAVLRDRPGGAPTAWARGASASSPSATPTSSGRAARSPTPRSSARLPTSSTSWACPSSPFLVNSRRALTAARGLPGPGGARSRDPDHLDKLDKLSPDAVVVKLVGRQACRRPAWRRRLSATSAARTRRRTSATLESSDAGRAGLDEVDQLLRLVEGQIPAERISFSPRLVRGLEYYTGVIFEIVAPGVPGRLRPAALRRGRHARPARAGRPGQRRLLGIERILPLLGERASRERRADVAVPILGQDSPPTPSGWRPACAGSARRSPLSAAVAKLGRQPGRGERPGRPLRRDPRPRRARRGAWSPCGTWRAASRPGSAPDQAPRWVPRGEVAAAAGRSASPRDADLHGP